MFLAVHIEERNDILGYLLPALARDKGTKVGARLLIIA
jgi:hypothetical protein